MRFKQLLSEQQLDEIRMSPGALRKFAASPEAEGIRAGFEAELVFTGLGADDDQEWEPDYDADERARSISEVIEFFQNDEWGYGLSDREASRLEERLSEAYYEWYDDQMYSAFREEAEDLVRKVIEDEEWDWDDAVRNQLDDMGLEDDEIEEAMKQGQAAPRFTRLSDQEAYSETHPGYERYLEAYSAAEEILNDLVEESVNKQDKYWDQALDDFRDNFSIDDDSGFFSDVGLRWMSDVANEYDLMWPVMTVTGGEGGFDESNAEMLARGLEQELGVKTKVSGGYHSASRDEETWIFEPDSSLDSDDPENMPVEIVSPPMPLDECLTKMAQFFEWAESNGAYSNSSTGFHMGVSLPYTGGRVDYLKLALFLGDEYVLNEFGRSANRYAEAAMKKIRQRIKGSDVSGAMELMRNNLLELAQKSLEINNHGFGKYTSINPQGGVDSTRPDKEQPAKYIEFRSAGGTNYFEDVEKLQNTLLRYARAMSIAANPSAERREYYTKLYKLLTPSREATGGVELFAEFATGKISKEELKKRWAESALQKDAPELTQKGDWVVVSTINHKPVQGQSYNGYTKQEVYDKAKQKLSPGSSDIDFKQSYEIMPFNSGKWEIYADDSDFSDEESTLEIVDANSRGEAVDKVYDKYNELKIPFKVRPWYGDAQPRPEPKLTPRAQLAKRIKQPAPGLRYNYEIVDRRNQQVVLQYNAADENDAHNKFNNWLRNQGMPLETENYGYRHIGAQSAVRDVGIDVAQNFTQPQQVHDASGVPVWEIYQRDNGHVVHTFSNLQQSSAWTQAQQWLRDIGAEPSAFDEFSVRPKMSANENTVDPISGRGAVAPGPIAMTKPQSQVKPVTPAAKVDINQRQPDPYALTYKKIKEWEDVVESMIKPVGRLGQ